MEVKLQSLCNPLAKEACDSMVQVGQTCPFRNSIVSLVEHQCTCLTFLCITSLRRRPSSPTVCRKQMFSAGVWYWHIHVRISDRCLTEENSRIDGTLPRCEGICLSEGGWVCRRLCFSCVFLLWRSRLAFIALTEPIHVYLSSNWKHPSGRHCLFIPWHRESMCVHACTCAFSSYCLIIALPPRWRKQRIRAREGDLLIQWFRLFIFNRWRWLHAGVSVLFSALINSLYFLIQL